MLKQASKDKIVYGEESYFPLKDSGFYDAKVDTFTKFAQSKNQLNTLLVQTANLLTSTSKEEFVYSPNCQLLSADNLKIVQHFEKLKERLNDKHSKVLITGDLNSGKSTFVNTLLKRQIVPDDQEPCTALFVEVIDQKENQDKEEVHCINDIGLYNPLDSTTFKSIKIDELRDEVENEEPQFNLLKVYCKDNEDDTKLLHNGLVDISLIDSPGLNIDSLKTTALFTKQEEIDVIVFVVNAENHFTLSGKEFLETATKEKQYVFIVVNKFDSIRKKERNQREILEQIRSISKSTYEDRENLVHFVSSKKTFEHYITGTEDQNQDLDYVAGFEKLKTALRSFVLERRMNSKLAPAKLYLHNVLLDLEYVLESNLQLQFRIQEDITMKMEKSEPGYSKLVQIQKKINQECSERIEKITKEVEVESCLKLEEFYKEFELFMGAVEWKGVLHVFEYTEELRIIIGRLASIRLKACYKLSHELTTKEFQGIYSTANEVLGDDEKVEFNEKVESEPNFQNAVL